MIFSLYINNTCVCIVKETRKKKLLYQLPIQYYTINRQEYLIHIHSMLNKNIINKLNRILLHDSHVTWEK